MLAAIKVLFYWRKCEPLHLLILIWQLNLMSKQMILNLKQNNIIDYVQILLNLTVLALAEISTEHQYLRLILKVYSPKGLAGL